MPTKLLCAEPDIAAADRRKFLATCGKFAVVTPPAVTMLLSTSLTSTAVAASAGGQTSNSEGQQGAGVSGAFIVAVSTAISLLALGTVIYLQRSVGPQGSAGISRRDD